jgi:hypothetical protein
MKTSAITKALKNPSLQDESMSLGFRRYFILPNRIKVNIQTAHLIETGSLNWHDTVVAFFEAMTDNQYTEYLKAA